MSSLVLAVLPVGATRARPKFVSRGPERQAHAVLVPALSAERVHAPWLRGDVGVYVPSYEALAPKILRDTKLRIKAELLQRFQYAGEIVEVPPATPDDNKPRLRVVK